MGEIPTHVAIIMDGNGRWAKKQGQERLFGHNVGTESVRVCSEFAVEKGIKYLSLFVFSEENWNRPKEEIDGLMELMMQSIANEKETFRKNNIRFRVIGERRKLSDTLLKSIDEAEHETADNSGLNLLVFLNYSGKWDILQAASRYSKDALTAQREGKQAEPLTYGLFDGYLSTCGIPDPDLLIRTSGEQRISNFMLWQCAYTEFYYTDVLWPDFRKTDFNLALESFNKRERRYGKIK